MLAFQNLQNGDNPAPENMSEKFRTTFYAGHFAPDNWPLSRRSETAYFSKLTKTIETCRYMCAYIIFVAYVSAFVNISMAFSVN